MLPDLQQYLQFPTDFPQHNVVDLPALSPTMSQGTLVSWEKKEGQEVRRGDIVAQVETDKATMDMESPRNGFIAKLLLPGGTKDIALGTVSIVVKVARRSCVSVYVHVCVRVCLCVCGEVEGTCLGLLSLCQSSVLHSCMRGVNLTWHHCFCLVA